MIYSAEANRIAEALFLAMPLLVILATGAAKALHDAWIGTKRFSPAQRTAMAAAANIILVPFALVLRESALNYNQISEALRLFREVSPIFGWAATITLLLAPATMLMSVITIFKINSDDRRYGYLTKERIREAEAYFTAGRTDDYTRYDHHGRLLGSVA